MARTTLADVAARVGVSTKSVSNVVNGTGWVSAGVRDRILEAIDELGYRPNLAARQLRNGRSGLIALVIPDLREPYFAEFSSSFVAAAQRRGLTVLVAQTDGDLAIERGLIDGEGLPALDGLVMSPLALHTEHLEERRGTTPLVLVGEEAQAIHAPGVHHVGVDNVAAAAAATAHLLDLGRTRIAALGVQHEGPTATSRLRFEGYRRTLARAGIELDESLLAPVEHFNRDEGSRAVQKLLDAGVEFDGLFCFNDSLALGALYTLGVRRIAVPDDVAVVGFDDIDEGRYVTPAFSTINPGVEAAAEMILDILAAPDAMEAGHHGVPFTVVAR
ncbi:LacI family DNA-binding transcriptional regulator [Herbiconiux sp. P17]|uniref:LacI family DNA-binding transcriptional regulator n=1 Tax=Herbiconiux wuyangfengii TaxID=3342794 RepID=UPI0035B8CD0A